jgi:hypothetical protein
VPFIAMEDQTIWCRFTKADFIDMLDKINNVSVVKETIAEVFRRSYVVTDKVVYNINQSMYLTPVMKTSENVQCLIRTLIDKSFESIRDARFEAYIEKNFQKEMNALYKCSKDLVKDVITICKIPSSRLDK